MLKIPYNIKKALVNCAFIYTGVLAVKLAPYMNQLSLGIVPSDLLVGAFWKHALISGIVVTGAAEFRYLVKWLATMNGTKTFTCAGTYVEIPTKQENKDEKKNPLSLT